MKKTMLTTFLALISCQSFAALTSQGSATTTMTLNAPAVWSIAKGMDSEGTLAAGNVYTGDSIMNHAATIYVRNGSATAGTYYIRGQGDSQGSSGEILWVNASDNTDKHIIPNVATKLESTWNLTENAYQGNTPLGPGEEITFNFYGNDGDVFKPGVYTVSLELFTETP